MTTTAFQGTSVHLSGELPAVGDRLVAEGRVLRAGRRIVVVAADVFAEGSSGRRHVATMLGTMVPVDA